MSGVIKRTLKNEQECEVTKFQAKEPWRNRVKRKVKERANKILDGPEKCNRKTKPSRGITYL